MDQTKSYYAVNDRLRTSVMLAQAGNNSLREAYESSSHPRNRQAFKPEFNEESFSSALATITVVVEGLCFEGAGGWEVKQRLVVDKPRLTMKFLLGQSSNPPELVGDDRAVSAFSFLSLELFFLSWEGEAWVKRFLLRCGRDASYFLFLCCDGVMYSTRRKYANYEST